MRYKEEREMQEHPSKLVNFNEIAIREASHMC